MTLGNVELSKCVVDDQYTALLLPFLNAGQIRLDNNSINIMTLGNVELSKCVVDDQYTAVLLPFLNAGQIRLDGDYKDDSSNPHFSSIVYLMLVYISFCVCSYTRSEKECSARNLRLVC
jgi:hypothetical protein